MNQQELKRHIRNLAVRLPDPDNQFPTFDGLPGEPGGILIQRRSEQLKINRGKSLLQLFHRRFVLTVAMETEGLTCVNDVTFPIAPDYATLVYPFQYHHYMVDQSHFFWIVITFELDRVFYPDHLYHCSVHVSENSYALLARMLELYQEPEGATDPRLRRYLNCLLAELDVETQRINVGLHVPAEDLQVRLFEEINGYICRYIADPTLSVERIARKYRVSKSYLYAIFEKMLRCHPAEYIRQLRLKQAMRLLSSGRFFLSEIALQCGFTSHSTFCRCFRREMGMTPGEYIRSHAAAIADMPPEEQEHRDGDHRQVPPLP